jgi:hypothetical protein
LQAWIHVAPHTNLAAAFVAERNALYDPAHAQKRTAADLEERVSRAEALADERSELEAFLDGVVTDVAAYGIASSFF